MAQSRAGVFFGIVVVAAAAGLGWLALARKGAEPAANPAPVVGPVPDAGTLPKEPSPPRERATLPPAAPVPATKQGCEGFLAAMAAVPSPPPGGGLVFLFPEVRAAAMDAWNALDSAAAEPAVLAALGGDGDATEWSEDRLHAAGIRLRAGKPDGAATLAEFLKTGAEMVDADGLPDAARSASWLPPGEGGNFVRRLLAEPADGFDEEHLEEILRTAAVLGNGASPADLKRFLDAEDGTWELGVVGAAAGALMRLGDDSGGKVIDALAAEDWFDAEEAARGLGARGNVSVLPWLTRMLTCDQEWTRAAAARAMGVVGDRSSVPALVKALADPDGDVQAEAAIALLRVGDRTGIDRARKALSDMDPEIRTAAWRAVFESSDEGSREAATALLGVGCPNPKDPKRGPEAQCRVWAAALLLRLGVR